MYIGAVRIRIRYARAALLCGILAPALMAQATPDDEIPIPLLPVRTPESGISNDRIMGIIPNFQTVSDPATPYVPLKVREKWWLFVKESVDPYSFATAAAGAGISQIGDNAPKFGEGGLSYLQRFGAAQADLTTQNFFSDAVLASVLHEDPRYFRMGPTSSVIKRVSYAMSRIVITRRDSGHDGFNFSGILGMGMGIALSDVYYPPKSVGGGELEWRLVTSLSAAALGNLLPEFWPDVREKLAHRRHKKDTPATAAPGVP